MLDLVDFPVGPLATRLRHLVALDLRENDLERLPSEIALLTSLEALDVSKNNLRLFKSDIQLLAALANLQTIALLVQGPLSRHRHLSKASLSHLQSYSERFPHVKVL